MSEALRDLVVSLSLQTDNFTRNIRSVNRQIQEAESYFRQASAGVEGFEQSAAGLSTKLSTLERKLSLQQDAVDTRYCHNRTIGKGVLLALKEFADMLGPREGITDYFREFNKYFNRYGAVSSLDFLDSDDIYHIAIDYLVKNRKEKLESRNR